MAGAPVIAPAGGQPTMALPDQGADHGGHDRRRDAELAGPEGCSR